MAIEFKDIIRLEGTTILLPTKCKAGQVGFEIDGTERQRREMLANGVVLHWTPDENFSSDLVGYTNANFPQLTTLKLATDYILGNSSLVIEPIYIVGNNVGIGTSNPIEKLHVEGNMLVNGITKTSEIRSATNLALYSDGADETISINGETLLVNTYNFTVESSTAQINSAILLQNGTVGIGTYSPTQVLDVVGNARFRSIGSDASSGALYYAADGTLTTNASDARLKYDIKDLDELTLQKLLDLRPVSFKWNGSNVDSLGLIAQEVQEVFPELVFTNENTGFLGVKYELLNSLLLKALQQQNKKIENILERLERLEGNL